MKYKHVQGSSAEDLDSKVQELLDVGWQLCGTPYLAGNIFFQCVTTGEAEASGLTVNDIATLSLLKRGRFY